MPILVMTRLTRYLIILVSRLEISVLRFEISSLVASLSMMVSIRVTRLSIVMSIVPPELFLVLVAHNQVLHKIKNMKRGSNIQLSLECYAFGLHAANANPALFCIWGLTLHI